MSRFIEGAPIEGIKDINTFNLWYIGFRASVIEQSLQEGTPLRTTFREKPWSDGRSERFLVGLNHYPFGRLPSNLRAVMGWQYSAAKADEAKSVYISLQKDEIGFQLNAPSVDPKTGFDAYSEMYEDGVRLQLAGEEKGLWVMMKSPVSGASLQLDQMFKADRPFDDEMESLLDEVLKETQRISRFSTLPQLHDVARVLHDGRAHIKLARIATREDK